MRREVRLLLSQTFFWMRIFLLMKTGKNLNIGCKNNMLREPLFVQFVQGPICSLILDC